MSLSEKRRRHGAQKGWLGSEARVQRSRAGTVRKNGGREKTSKTSRRIIEGQIEAGRKLEGMIEGR